MIAANTIGHTETAILLAAATPFPILEGPGFPLIKAVNTPKARCLC